VHGVFCDCCQRKVPIEERWWEVLARHRRCSAFDGYRVRASAYSAVRCRVCGHVWRTKAAYVEKLPDAPPVGR
jgi:hypothetical protein